jgi:UDP-3-O-[3-hydroxymyristoyl] N-acetylglucosamine deacetylase
MQITPQGTISAPLQFKGPGLHTAKRHKINILPASENSGIVFVKMPKKWGGVKNKIEVPAHWKNVKTLPLCTCLASKDGHQIRTIEHLMAAFYACGVDNAIVEVKGSEIPILDGSAKVFIDAIEATGVTTQDQSRIIHRVIETTEFSEGKRFVRIEPADKLIFDISISLSHFGQLTWQGEVTPEIFKNEMSSARTFGRLKNGLLAKFTRFQKDPICLGANMKTALVIDSKDNILNKDGLRMENEIIYHRVLDLVGDLMLANGHILGKVTAKSSAHRLNHGLLESLFKQENIETIKPTLIQ